ncbi:MAG: PilZ domain-containing protein [Xanthobacteraceae bacterium]
MVKEKRKSIRRAMRYTAWIGFDEGSPLRGCMVFDISETGARLELDNPWDVPDVFNLLLSGRGGVYRQCRTMWREGNQIGVCFEEAGARRRTAAETASA